MFGRFFVLFFCLVWAIFSARADDVSGAENNLSMFDATISQMQSEYDELKKYVSVHNPKLYTQISDLDEAQQLVAIRSWIAQELFDWFYDKYMDDIAVRAKQTGRQLHTQEFNGNFSENLFWLDRYEHEKQECQESIKNRIACDYPDGYEEFYISYKVTDNSGEQIKSLSVTRDDIARDVSEYLEISLVNRGGQTANETVSDIDIEISHQIENYAEYHAWRNKDAALIRAGKYTGNVSDDDISIPSAKVFSKHVNFSSYKRQGEQ